MNQFRNIFLTIIFALSAAALSSAASDIYFAPTAAGSNNGTSCANAYASNDGAHGWSLSAQQSAGNNLHICSGTYTASAGATVFQTVNNGSSGSPITLIADQGAATIQAPYLGSADGTSPGFIITNNYWTINGGNNLTIQNSLNGDSGGSCPGGTCTNRQGSVVIMRSTGSNVIIENIAQFGPSFVKTAGVEDGGLDSTIVLTMAANTHVTNNSFTGGWNLINFGASNIEVDHNTVTNCGHCLSTSLTGTSTSISNLKIHDNHFAGANALYDTADDEYHVNAYIVFLDSNVCTGCSITGFQYYNNLCDGLWSKVSELNACVFLDEQGSNTINGYAFYNNVVNLQDGNYSNGPSGGVLVAEDQNTSNSGSYILNNTIYMPTSDSVGCIHVNNITSMTMENNIIQSCGYHFLSNGSTFSSLTFDYNTWYDPSVGYSSGWIYPANCTGGGCGFKGSTSWQASGFDQHGQAGNNPLLNTTTFALGSGSPAIGAGTNLTSLCSSFPALCQGAPQTFGYSGSCGAGCLSRASSGNWDAGAYPYSSGDPPPNPPTALSAIVN